MYVKVRFLKNGVQSPREYTYSTNLELAVGVQVHLPNNAVGVVTVLDVPETEVAGFKYRIKEITEVMETNKESEEK